MPVLLSCKCLKVWTVNHWTVKPHWHVTNYMQVGLVLGYQWLLKPKSLVFWLQALPAESVDSIFIPQRGYMDHVCNLIGFPTNQITCLMVKQDPLCGTMWNRVYKCVLTVAPWMPANVLSSGFFKVGSLTHVLHEPLRRVTFTTVGALGAG